MKKSSEKSASNGTEKKATSMAKIAQGSKHAEDLGVIFEDLLKDIYWAEKHLTKALPKLAKAALGENLKAGFEKHLEETKIQVTRLEQVFEMLGKKAQAKKCEAMEGLVKEGEEAIEEYEEGFARDAALIVAAQKVEHYEIATYGSLRTHASLLGFDEAAAIFEETLNEEKNTDVTLTQLAETINEWALHPEEAQA